jgi:hypothetical protein
MSNLNVEQSASAWTFYVPLLASPLAQKKEEEKTRKKWENFKELKCTCYRVSNLATFVSQLQFN